MKNKKTGFLSVFCAAMLVISAIVAVYAEGETNTMVISQTGYTDIRNPYYLSWHACAIISMTAETSPDKS